jgi:hypothetical protein
LLLCRQTETAFGPDRYSPMIDRFLALLSLGTVALIVAAPLWF